MNDSQTLRPYSSSAASEISNDSGVTGSMVSDALDWLNANKQPLDATLTALAALDSTAGILTITGADTFVRRTLSAPAAGLTITNPAGTAGNPTFALANDLAALEGLSGTGLGVRTASDTWANRSIAVGSAKLTVSNGDGVSGNPTLDLGSVAAADLSNGVSGSGAVCLVNTPTLITPVLGVATATSINKVAVTAPATSATLTLGDGSALVTSGANSITLTSTGATNVTLPTTGTLSTLAGSETLTNKTLTSPTINSPTMTTPTLGVATATSVNKVAITAPATSATLTIADGKTLTASNTVTLTATDGSTLAIGTGGTLAALAYLSSVDCSGSQVTGTLAAGRFPALTGDVTTIAGSLTTFIGNNVVTYAKFQQVAARSLVGNATGSLADATGITLGTSLQFSGSTLNTIQGLRTTDNPTFAALTVTTLNKVTVTAPASGATLTLAQGSALITSGANAITLTSTGITNVTLPTTGTLSTLAGSETLTNKTLTSPTINSPTMTTPTLGVATATSVNKVAITAPATSATLTIADGKTLTASNTVTLTATDGSTLAIGTGGTLAALAYLSSVDCSGSQVTGTLAAGRFPALTGDVTTIAGSLTTFIGNNVVTYAKFQQVAARSLVGNATGSLADATGITLGTSLQFSGSTINTVQDIRTSASPTFAGATFTSSTIAGPTINGGSSSGQGGYFLWQRTGAANPFFLGHRSAILGGTSGNALLYSSGDNIELAPAATATVLLTTTASTFATQILSTYASAGSGYATGAGGSVTQTTSRTTGVTLSKPCGQITTHTASLAAGATAKFTVTNTLVAAADHVDVSIQSGTTTDGTRVRVQSVAAGSFTIVVENGHASTAETGAIVINFALTKVVTS